MRKMILFILVFLFSLHCSSYNLNSTEFNNLLLKINFNKFITYQFSSFDLEFQGTPKIHDDAFGLYLISMNYLVLKKVNYGWGSNAHDGYTYIYSETLKPYILYLNENKH